VVNFEVNMDFSKSISQANALWKKTSSLQSNFFAAKKEAEGMRDALQDSVRQLRMSGASLEQVAALEGSVANKMQMLEWRLQDVNDQQEAFNELVGHGGDQLADVISRIPLIGGLLSPMFRRPLDRLNDMNMSMGRFNKAFATLTKDGKSLDSVFSGFFQNFSTNIATFGKNFHKAFSGGATAMLKNIPTIFSGIATSAGALIPVLASIALPILGIVAAVFTLKKIWDLNIGGIQKQVFGLMGVFRDVFGKTMINFQKSLQKLGPLFKLIFTPLFTILKGVGKLLGGLFDGVFAIIDPILDVINEIFAPLAEGQSQAMGLVDVFGILADTLRVVGKIVGFVLKVALTPMKLMFRVGMAIGKVLAGWVGKFMKLKFVQNFVQRVKDNFEMLKSVLEALLKPFKFLIEGFEKISNFLGGDEEKEIKVKDVSPGAAGISPAGRPVTSVNNTSSRVINNNPNITVQTSREISGAGGKQFANTLGGMLSSQNAAL